MKYPAHTYAKALAEALAGKNSAEAETVGSNFLAMVERNGDASHLLKILEEAGRIARIESGEQKIVFESARPLDAKHKKELQAFVRPGDLVQEIINPELIAGVRVVVDNERQFDGSLKGKLDSLFA